MQLDQIEKRLNSLLSIATQHNERLDLIEKQLGPKDWVEITKLKNNDACECTPKEHDELKLLGSEFLHNSTDHGPNMRWDTNFIKPLVETSVPKEFNPNYKLNWIPFSEFKRRLQGTIAEAKKKEWPFINELQDGDYTKVTDDEWIRRAKGTASRLEAERKVEFGTRVKYQNMDYRVASEGPDALGFYALIRRTHLYYDTVQATRSEFTITQPKPEENG